MNSILVLGAGEVGAAAVDYAARLPEVNRIMVGDLSTERAVAAVARLAPGKAEAVALDVTDPTALARALQNKRAVLNTVGPFFRFALPVFRAALDAGVTYLDVADDWEPTLDLLALDADAKAAGVTAVIGMGASPGLANLLARAAMEDRQDATELVTVWRADDVGDGYSAAKEHWLHQCTGTIRVLSDGRMVDEPPLRPIALDYPAIGAIKVVTVGHPEAVTLPRRYPRLRHCVNAMAVPPKLLALLQATLAEPNLNLRRAATEFSDRYRALGAEDDPVTGSLPGMFAVTRDAQGGASVATILRYPDGLGPVTSSPLAAALTLILNGEGPGPGVWTPEDAFAPDRFLERFGRLIGGSGDVWRLERL